VTGRRSPIWAVVACFVGGLLVLLAGGRQWAHTSVRGVEGGAAVALSVTGHQVASSLPALGIALLALSAAIIAASGVMRRMVGIVIVIVSATAVGVSIAARSNVSAALERREVGAQGIVVHATANGWWLVATLGGLLALAAGVMTVIRANRWSALGERYEAPGGKPAADPGSGSATGTWDALDRGEDPTA
jgi:uncharacterized protein involved in response to NO